MKQGQALVVMLLIIAVTATIGLSIATRSTSQVSMSTTQDESFRAMEAAEVGVERALGGLIAPNASETQTVTSINAQYHATNNEISGKDKFKYPYPLVSGDTVTVILGDGVTGGDYTGNSLWICWGDGTENPGIELTLYYKDTESGPVKTARSGYVNASWPGFFTPQNNSCPGLTGYQYRAKIDNIDTVDFPVSLPLVLRIRMLNNNKSQPLAIDGQGTTFPPQANEITSTGQSGGATQNIRVTRLMPDYQSMFDAAVWSGMGLSK